MITVICKQCGKEFKTYPCLIKSGRRKFCSKACYSESMKTQVTRICEQCGKEFKANPSQIKRGYSKFCSQSCLGESKKGPNHPQWIEDRSQLKHKELYCSRWTAELRRRIRAFGQDRCMVCGKTYAENGNKHMSCHHTDYDKNSCCTKDKRYFAPLCVSCHGKTGVESDRAFWEYALRRIADEMYGGKTYYTASEIEAMGWILTSEEFGE